MQCPKHPDLPARFRCEKYALEMCERCMECRSPDIYCKHRPQCMIWELLREDYDENPTEE